MTLKNPIVTMHTNRGDIVIELDQEKAPKSVKNFLDYVEAKHFDGLIFHRVIKNFMIQGGGFTPDMKQRETREPIENEAANGLKNDKYTIAMARTNAPHSATSQFFINTVDNAFLNYTSATPQGYGYAVFGKVVAGQSVIDGISVAKTKSVGFHQDVPVEDIIIESVRVAQFDVAMEDVKE